MSTVVARTPRWERRKESRPGELLSAALDLFVERGFAATRLDDVAARAGVSKGTLYLYYSSKEDLFKAVVRQNIVPLIEEFRAAVEDSPDPAPILLQRFFPGWWERFGATRLAGIAKLIIAEAGNFPEVARFFHEEVVLPNSLLLGSIVRRGIDDGDFRDVDVEAAVHIWMAPVVLKAIWAHSIAPCCPGEMELPIDRFLAAHTDYILASLDRGRGAP